MQPLRTYIEGFANSNLIPLAVTAIFVLIIIIGFSFFGTKAAKEWGKGQIFWTIAGAALIYTAFTLAQDIAKSFGY